MKTELKQTASLDLNLFNVSGEFEDIEMVINELSGNVEMSIMSRRC